MHMLVRKQRDKVGSVVPRRLAHSIGNLQAIHRQIDERHISDQSVLIVAQELRRVGMMTVVNKILDHDMCEFPDRVRYCTWCYP